MDIVAVIPARANSKRIPNKNIRLLNNHPLIYYAIKNALESKYITKVIVTTDSKEVEIIAHQSGVECIQRKSELCQDKTTLDPVIFDTVSKLSCDYVVTLQPTTPLLKVASLDTAIEKCISDSSIDTIVSVINFPRLAWKRNDSILTPLYSERLNCQYLPPYYRETGAFIITKKESLLEHNCIGNHVDIYETTSEEAINISTFQDLELASCIMQTKKVGMYVNGNNTRGLGHIYRSLELADEFYTKPDIYFDQNQTDISIFGDTTHKLIPVNGLDELLIKLKEKDYDIFINDILSTSIDYMIALRNCIPNAKLINFEDEGEGIYQADLVFNALFQKQDIAKVKAGEAYYIAPKLFMFYQPIQIREHVKNVLLTFGGADPQGYTDRILNTITSSPQKYSTYHFYVILGSAKKNVDALLEYNSQPNIQVLFDINNMPEIMSKCDIAVTSRGRTGYELAMLGIPTIAAAQNEREESHGFICHENGFNYLGLNPSDRVLETNMDLYLHLSKEEREECQRKMLKKNLRNGRKRVMNLINSL